MVNLKKKRWFSKKIVIVLIIGGLLIANIASFLFTQLDQFNLFHKYQEAYSLEDWNLPHNVDVDTDGDGKKDKVTFYRCIFLSSVDTDKIPQSNACYDSLVGKGKTKGYQVPHPNKKLINSYLGRKDNIWNIVIITVGETKLYEITSEGVVVEKEPPIALKIDSLLYSLTHLFALVI